METQAHIVAVHSPAHQGSWSHPSPHTQRAPWRVRLVRNLIRPISRRLHSSSDLLPAVAAGTPNAMNACIERYSNLVWSLVKKRVPNHATAEDLTQEIFTELWKSAHRFDPNQTSEPGFIAMITRRRVIDHLRKCHSSPPTETLDHLDLPPPSPPYNPPPIDHDSLERALQTLPQDTQNLFQLHFYQGLTHQEIANTTGLPLGSVKTRIRRGLIQIRENLQLSAPSHPSRPHHE